jgi:hypothetical protein
MKYKHMIKEVFVLPWRIGKVLDQDGNEMPQFQGVRTIAMFKIKARIERQKPCSIIWHLREGAEKTFTGIKGMDEEVFYPAPIPRRKFQSLNVNKEFEAKKP